MPAFSSPTAMPPAPANNSIDVTPVALCTASGASNGSASTMSSIRVCNNSHKRTTAALTGTYDADSVCDNCASVTSSLRASSFCVFMPTRAIASCTAIRLILYISFVPHFLRKKYNIKNPRGQQNYCDFSRIVLQWAHKGGNALCKVT